MTKKFRPYFTHSELEEVISCVKKSSSNLTLLRYLESFSIKIKHGTVAPSSEYESPSEKLGFTATPVSKDDAKNAAYAKWLNYPASCTSTEMTLVHEYRYENDLMDAGEEGIYLTSLNLYSIDLEP